MKDLYQDHGIIVGANSLSKRMREKNICLYLTGLAASGKSAVAGVVSRLTGIPLVDSGLPFRLATYLCKHVPAITEDLNLFSKLMKKHTIQVINGEYHLFSGKEDITERLRSEEIDWGVPIIAGNLKMRGIVLQYLRSNTKAPAIVSARGATEPLTTGHIVQIQLKANLDVRVKRRMNQEDLPYDTVRKSIRERDQRDLLGPSRYPSADYLDTSRLSLEETVAKVIEKTINRIDSLSSYDSFRRVVIQNDIQVFNPLLKRVWECSEELVKDLELKAGIPFGHSKARFLLHLSRFSASELFKSSANDKCIWPPGVFPREVPEDCLMVDQDILNYEANRIVLERKETIDGFLAETLFPAKFFETCKPTQVQRRGSNLIATDEQGQITERLEIKDTSLEFGVAVEEYLHYLGIPRKDTTHRIALVEKSTDLPVLYMSFAPNTRKYTEPLLWAFGLRMEEVAVAVRGYGTPRCPGNAMGIFLRMACKRVAEDFPHLKAILTDINPNWGFSGNSFKEAGFISVGLKHAPTSFIGEEYASRRSLENQKGQKAAMPSRLSLVPSLIMLYPLNKNIGSEIESKANNGLFLIPQILYNKETS